MTAEWQRLILSGDVRALARAATAVENQTPAAQELLAAVFPQTGRAVTVGITGPPGVGKSTLVDQLTAVLRGGGKSVGIIAVDPSSAFSQGAILADRIRMQRHHADPGVFIRSMASRGKLGGLARGTLEMSWLLDASGRDFVLVETLGVGQDEVDIARLADIVLVVLAPGFGDDVQAIKAGIMEIADIFVINKSDMPGADRLAQEIRASQGLASHASLSDAAPIVRVVATEGVGVNDLSTAISALRGSPARRGNPAGQWALRLREMLRDSLLQSLPDAAFEEHARRVAAKIEDPYAALAALRKSIVSHGH